MLSHSSLDHNFGCYAILFSFVRRRIQTAILYQCCVMIHRDQVYWITLFLSWTMIEPITTQNQWNTVHDNSSVIRLLLYYIIVYKFSSVFIFGIQIAKNHMRGIMAKASRTGQRSKLVFGIQLVLSTVQNWCINIIIGNNIFQRLKQGCSDINETKICCILSKIFWSSWSFSFVQDLYEKWFKMVKNMI